MSTTLTPQRLQELIAGDKPVIVDFFATWCQPCKTMAPAVDALAESLAGKAEVIKVDIEEHPEFSAANQVRGVPTFKVFRGGAVVASKSGAMPHPAFIDWARGQVA